MLHAIRAGAGRMRRGREDGILNGVSGLVLSTLLAGARRGGVAVEMLSLDLGIDVGALADPTGRVPWETFVRIVDRIAREIGGPDELRRFSESELATGSFGIFRSIFRVLAHPRDVYSAGARWMGPSLFPMIRADFWDGPDGILVQRLTLEPDHTDCPALYHLMHGALIALPRAWGHGPSEVQLELAPRRAIYAIRASSTRRGALSRLVRAVRARFAFPTMLRELEEQQRSIDASYRELRDAHQRISHQAADLARVDSIGRELSKDVDLDRVLDGLMRVLKDELGLAGAELWLVDVRETVVEIEVPVPAPLRRMRQTGTLEGPPLRRHPLASAGRPLGELVVWGPPGRAQNAATPLLELLVPWIALAIDNALTYARLERHAEVLEERVRERTARLLAVNHHLVREIDERKRATDALLQSEAQLRASERLASIGTLASGIAHEINNPVGAILAAAQLAQMLRSDGDAGHQVDAALVDIIAEAKRCGDIVRGVLQFAREERTHKWPCSLRDVVFRSVRLTAAFSEQHGARLVPEVPDESPWAHANPTQLEQAIVNLVRNAIESGASQVRVTLRTEETDRSATIEVQDDGAGISPSDRLRVLEPFYTTRRATGGTGLGLSVVHGIAEEHGGSLAITSSEGGGSIVALTLPCIDAPPPRAPEIVEKTEPTAPAPGRP